MIGLYAPIYPLKGYCIPFSAPKHLSSNEIPSRIVTNGIIYNTLLGDQVRTTSVGEFSGWSTEPDSDVDKRFRNAVTEFMPQLKNEIMSHPTRCGLRPYVSDGAVLLGRVEQVSNLLINCGPGSNGWKIALGAGEVVARSAANENIDDGFSFNSSYLSPKGRIKNAPIFSKVSLARWSYGT